MTDLGVVAAVSLGLLGIAAGVVVLAKPGASVPTLPLIAGVFVLVYGIFEIAAAITWHTDRRGVVAVLSVIIGIVLIRHPIAGVAALALMIALWPIAIRARADHRGVFHG